MPLLCSFALFVLVVSAVIGYGAVFLAAATGPELTRADPVDAAAVAGAGYRVGALRNEQACHLVGPAGLAAVATSGGVVAWTAVWPWIALGLWLATVVIRLAVVQPGRRALLVILAELAGSHVEHEPRRAQLGPAVRRVQLGLAGCGLLVVVAAAVVTFRPGG